jgi:hypothetical protein
VRGRALVLVALLLVACGGRPEGDPGLDIQSETDCGVLDREFVEAIEEAQSLRERGEDDAAEERQAYAEEADLRAREIGCYL